MTHRSAAWMLASCAFCALGADYSSRNFFVTASSPQVARQIGEAAEQLRDQLALEWLGQRLEPWPQPCWIEVQIDEGANPYAETGIRFAQREAPGFRMQLCAPEERLLVQTYLPHEVMHAVLATHFRRPLPRWADEGICLVVDGACRGPRHRQLIPWLHSRGRLLPLADLFAAYDYPPDVFPMYLQSGSLVEFLVSRREKREFLQFLKDGLEDQNWALAIRRSYGFHNLADMQDQWLRWVALGEQSAQQSTAPEKRTPRPAENADRGAFVRRSAASEALTLSPASY